MPGSQITDGDAPTLTPPNLGAPAVGVDLTLQFRHPALIKGLAYWRSRCHGTTMPKRDDINPSAMKGFLAHVALIEVPEPSDATGDYVIRVAGSEVERVFGPLNGKRLREAIPPVFAARWRSGYDHVVQSRAPIRFTGQVTYGGKVWLVGETLMAPLGDNAVVRMIFCAFGAWSGDDAPEA